MKLKDLVPWKNEKKGLSIRTEDQNPLTNFRNEMNRLFENFFEGFDLTPFGANMPVMDVVDKGTFLEVTAELPGMTEKDIDLTLINNVLTIKGEKKLEKEEKEGNVYRCERSYGTFQRSIPMPTEIDPEKVGATFKNGVLNIHLEKVAGSTNVRKINVKKQE